MSDAIQEKSSNLHQAPAQSFILFDQNDIQITLDLPSALQISQNGQEFYPLTPTQGKGAPMLYNNTKFPIESAKFTIKLEDVIDGASNVIANVRWWNKNFYDGQQIMEFTCGAVSSGGVGTCVPVSSGYSQVRWTTSVSSGRGRETFTLTYGSLSSSTTPPDKGPFVQIG